MPEMHHFTYGIVTPVLAYVASCLGAATGLSATSRARAATDAKSRAVWLLVGSLAIGGTGVWVMHFIAMLGFTVTDMPINYDVPQTILSALVAVVVVAIGLFIVGFAGDRPLWLVSGGIVAGLGVAAMHYMGIAAMRMTGHKEFSLPVVGLSVLIAIVAATAALWLAVNVRGRSATLGAALIMGVAVSGMHYTGMAALTITGTPGVPTSGTTAVDLLGPLILGIAALTVALVFVVLMWPTEEEMRDQQEFEARLRRRDQAAADRATRHATRRDTLPR
ncbi:MULTISPECIES: MHYT domain-containing protein [unclassified Isoptericola]|uniref:MHYT domain-containing protein n=1 Tax=Isoptericola sp. NPDC057191 TaxID=3346041 RepID=UPI00362F1F01